MATKKILTEPDPFLRQISQEVKKVDDGIRKLMDDMLDTMYDAPGIGLAAIQIGVPKRIIVIDIGRDKDKKEPRYFVNPVIKNRNTEKAKYEEGCLSVPDQFAEIEISWHVPPTCGSPRWRWEPSPIRTSATCGR